MKPLPSPKLYPMPVAAAASVLLLSLAIPAASEVSETAPEELILFVRPGAGTEIAETFGEEHLPSLREAAAELEVPVRLIDVDEAGAPADIHLTPLIAYQSYRGRAFFQGRYADSGKVAHFIRTQRAIPPVEGGFSKNDAAVWQMGRAKILAPLKITPLAGHVEPGFDQEAFATEARSAILEGFERFERHAEAKLTSSDRAFYMDFHPYRAEDGTLWVSTALFSQFNCIEPVFVGFDAPVSGPMDRFREVLTQAARQLERQVELQLAGSLIGDGFDPVPASTRIASWEALGLPLPERPRGHSAAAANVELPRRWRLEPAPENAAPRLVFRFPAPLERYSGEVGQLDGLLGLPTSPGVDNAEGWLEARTSSVTMGEDTLDNAVRGKMIFADKFPKARFVLEEVHDSEPLAFGRSSRLVAGGTFTMMGISTPLEVRAQLEPVIGDDGAPRLHVQAGFEIRLINPFGVKGPDGPAPANDTLQFHLDILMQAAGESGS